MLASLATGALKMGMQAASTAIANAQAFSLYKKQAALDYDYWQKKTDYENQLGLEQWNRENEYNSASNQVLRLKQAGLAPEMMYSNGTAGGVSADFTPIGASSGTGATFGNAQPASSFGLTDLSASDLNRKNAGLSAAKAVTEGTVQSLNEARTNLANEETQLTLQKYLTEGERTSFTRLQALLNQGFYNAMKREYDIDVIGSDGKKTTKQVKGFEMNLFATGIDCMLNLFVKSQNDANAQGIIRNIGEALSAEHATYVSMFGKDGIQQLQWDVTRHTLQQLIEPIDMSLATKLAKCDSVKDIANLFSGRKLTTVQLERLNAIREALEQLSHTFTGSTTEKYSGFISSALTGVSTALLLLVGKGKKGVGGIGQGSLQRTPPGRASAQSVGGNWDDNYPSGYDW